MAATAAILALLGGCGHVPKIIGSTRVPACAGATRTPISLPTWATAADIDHDGDTDILLLAVHAPTAAGVWASVVPLRAQGTEFCQDAAIAAWPLPRSPRTSNLPDRFTRAMQLRAEDIDADGHADVIVWHPVTNEAAVLHGTGASPPFTASRAAGSSVLARDGDPAQALQPRTSRERWDSVQSDDRGRAYVTTPELTVARDRGSRPPPGGRHRVPTPFRVDYAVYLDFTPDAHNFGTLVVGAGARLALQEDRSRPNHWRVLRLR